MEGKEAPEAEPYYWWRSERTPMALAHSDVNGPLAGKCVPYHKTAQEQPDDHEKEHKPSIWLAKSE